MRQKDDVIWERVSRGLETAREASQVVYEEWQKEKAQGKEVPSPESVIPQGPECLQNLTFMKGFEHANPRDP